MTHPMPPLRRLCRALCLTLTALGSVSASMSVAEGPDYFLMPISPLRDGQLNRVVTRTPGAQTVQSAIGNSVSVTQSGQGNTVILNLSQSNSGAVVAAGSLNGALKLN